MDDKERIQLLRHAAYFGILACVMNHPQKESMSLVVAGLQEPMRTEMREFLESDLDSDLQEIHKDERTAIAAMLIEILNDTSPNEGGPLANVVGLYMN